ncbi:MAG: hypothetical protein WDW38_010825 [Sanguina aurantia]
MDSSASSLAGLGDDYDADHEFLELLNSAAAAVASDPIASRHPHPLSPHPTSHHAPQQQLQQQQHAQQHMQLQGGGVQGADSGRTRSKQPAT